VAVLVVGSVAYDTIETPFGRAEETLGGAAVYFALAARLFTRVRLVGVVGDDFGEEHLELLRERGIDLGGLERAPGSTFRWAGRYGYDLGTRETLRTELNVFERFHPAIPAAWRETGIAFLGNIDPVLQARVLEQLPRRRLAVCDTMNYWIRDRRDELERLLADVDVLVVNDDEARQLAGTPNLAAAAARIRALGPRRLVVKKGEHGALLFGEEGAFSAPGLPLEAIVDPTGAGDAFAGGFVGHLAGRPRPDDADWRRAVVYGCVLGSFCVESFGVGRLVDLTRDEVEDRFELFLRLMHVPVAAAVGGDGEADDRG
jgi:sugar/nucleoside kinase (ribokinase family)